MVLRVWEHQPDSKTLQTRYPSSSLNLGPPAEGNNVEGVVELAVAAPVPGRRG